MNRWIGLLLLGLGLVSQSAMAADPRAKVTAALNVSALKAGQEAMAAVVLTIKPGFHSQSHTPLDSFLTPLVVEVNKSAEVSAKEAVYPPGKTETLKSGPASIYTGRAVVYVPLKVAADAKEGAMTISGVIHYQICDDSSCFQPEDVNWSISSKVVGAGEAVSANEPGLFKDYDAFAALPPTPTPPAGSTGGEGQVTVQNDPYGGVAFALGAAFVAGILFNIVPCVLPVLPIKVMGFAEVAQHNRGKTVALASVFGLGIVAVFAALAVLILVLHKFTWGQQFSNPWFAWGVVILLAGMAAWMFGWLNFNLPGGVYSFSPRHDTYLGNFEWGMLTAILSTPCTGPLFPPLMLWAQSQPTIVGVPAVMTVGLGMAFPYILLSAFPEMARRFPRVGPWAELFKQMMGFMLLGAAVFFAAGRFLHGAGLYWALVPVAAIAAIYLIVKTIQNGAHARGITIATVLAVILLAGSTGMAVTAVSPVNWQAYSDRTIDQARTKQIVLVKFTANWCLNCQYVERTVFHDKRTLAALDKYKVLSVKADLTDKNAPGWKRLNELSATGGIPLTAIYVPGQDKPVIIESVYTTDTLVKTLEGVGRGKVAMKK